MKDVQVVGESSSGKTQLCLQCTVQAARRGERVVYLCTEGGFPQVGTSTERYHGKDSSAEISHSVLSLY